MTFGYFGFVQNLFKFCCLVTVICMVSVWIQKFMRDEDLCLVDYKQFRYADDLGRTEVSLCFQDPFVEGKLHDMGANASTYVKHLSGEHFEEDLKNVNYTEVTLNLRDYYEGMMALSGDGTMMLIEDSALYSMGGTFYYGLFAQCFTISSKKAQMQNVKFLINTFI